MDMSSTGLIRLCSNVQVIKQAGYDSRSMRTAIISKWKKLYRDGFYYCWLEIIPDTTDYVNKDGTNGTIKLAKEVEVENKNIVRPAAIYDNEKSLYEET